MTVQSQSKQGRGPRVTDEMVDRACARLERIDDEFDDLPYEQATREAVRAILEAAVGRDAQ